MLDHSALVIFAGGVAIFIYGLHKASESLQDLSAERIREIIKMLSKKPYWGVFLGTIMTMCLQSSGAVTSMLVGLGAARMINLRQVMSLILGTAIGSTLTIQILSFNISRFGLPIFAACFFINFLTRRRILKEIMAVFMGFGLLFWGLEMIRFATDSFRDVETFNIFLNSLSETPILAVLFVAFITAIAHSSAVTIGLAMALAGHGMISIEDSIYWIFGANIGTTATALIASIGTNSVGRQVAWSHCFYKVASAIIALPFVPYLADLFTSDSPERNVANINTFYNCCAALLFYPGINYGAKVVENWIKPSEDEIEFSVKYLKKNDWESPSVVVAHAEREILRMSDIVISMVKDSFDLFRGRNPELIKSIRTRDDQTDLLSRELNLYLAQHIELAPKAIQLEMIRLMNYSVDLESAADVVDNQILELAIKSQNLKMVFSEEGWAELKQMANAVSSLADISIACFQTKDTDLAAKVLFQKRNIRKMEHNMRKTHIDRLVKGKSETISSSSTHLDLLSEYRRIVGLMSNHVYALLKSSDPYNLLPRDDWSREN